jgi:hypothetical protein
MHHKHDEHLQLRISEKYFFIHSGTSGVGMREGFNRIQCLKNFAYFPLNTAFHGNFKKLLSEKLWKLFNQVFFENFVL